MSAPRLRRRALTLTAAVAATAGLAFGAAAVPAVAAPAPAAASARFVSTNGQTFRDFIQSRTLPAMGDTAAVATRLKGLAPKAAGSSASTLSRMAVAASTVQPAPATNVAPARVNAAGNPDGTRPTTVVGDTLYGQSFSVDEMTTYLETWTDAGWRRVTNAPSLTYATAEYDGSLYVLAYKSLTSSSAATVLYRYDGSTFTALHTFKDEVTMIGSASGLTFVQLSPTGGSSTISTTTDGTTFTSATTTKNIFSTATLDGTVYLWVIGSSSAAIYKVDPAKATLVRVTATPLGLSAVEWNGALYFGGIATSGSAAGTIGAYTFDGTNAPTAFSAGVSFAKASWFPFFASTGDDLYFTVPGTKADALYSYDGTTTTKAGAIGSTDALSAGLLGYDGKVFATSVDFGGDLDTLGYDTWVYDPGADSTQPTPVVSSTPTIAGTPAVGVRSYATEGDWSPTAALSYQWYVGGTAIKGATKRYHTVLPNELAGALTVKVSGDGPGFLPASETSAPSAAVKAGTIVVKPVISGTMKAGTTLTALDRGTAPSNAKRTYRWYRDGKPLAGATKSTYRVTSGDVGHKITVGVNASATAYTSASAKSPARTATR